MVNNNGSNFARTSIIWRNRRERACRRTRVIPRVVVRLCIITHTYVLRVGETAAAVEGVGRGRQRDRRYHRLIGRGQR